MLNNDRKRARTLPLYSVLASQFTLIQGRLYTKEGKEITTERVRINDILYMTNRVKWKLEHKVEPRRYLWEHKVSKHTSPILVELIKIVEHNSLVLADVDTKAGVYRGMLSRAIKGIHRPNINAVEAFGEVVGYRLKWEKING